MERISILYVKKPQPTVVENAMKDSYKKNIFADLNLTLFDSYSTLTPAQTDKVHKIILDFSAKKEDILLRQETIRDFMENGELLQELADRMEAFANLKADMYEAKRLVMRTPETLHADTANLNYNHLASNCENMSVTYKYIRNMYSAMKKFNLKSAALKRFLEYSRTFVEDCSIGKLAQACADFSRYVNQGVIYDVDIKFNDLLHALSLRFFDMRYVKPEQSGFLNTVINIINKTDEKTKHIYVQKEHSYSCRLSPNDDVYLKGIIESQIKKLTKRISQIYEHLIDVFMDISDELNFYRYAIKMTEYMNEKGLSYVFPEISEMSGSISFKGLCDLTLAVNLTDNKNKRVVSNDFTLNETDGINIVLGANQSGKTTFLRSFGSSLIFAHCGMPVPAANAEIFLFTDLYTHFQRYDGDIRNQGQLNSELEELSGIVYGASPGSIILMNESFSSTGTKDALSISSDVLSAFSYIGSRVIFVTHLTALPETLRSCGKLNSKKNLEVYRTGKTASGLPTYKLERVSEGGLIFI